MCNNLFWLALQAGWWKRQAFSFFFKLDILNNWCSYKAFTQFRFLFIPASASAFSCYREMFFWMGNWNVEMLQAGHSDSDRYHLPGRLSVCCQSQERTWQDFPWLRVRIRQQEGIFHDAQSGAAYFWKELICDLFKCRDLCCICSWSLIL